MLIGERLKGLREEKRLSQGEIERRSGLLRCYISRVENGHTVPAIETLEKLARALEVPMYLLFYDGEKPPDAPILPKAPVSKWETSSRGNSYMALMRRSLSRMEETDRGLLLHMAKRVADRHS
jgi:transcriptional regulator with XRE-family HTH domain